MSFVVLSEVWIEFVLGGEGKKHVSPRLSQSKCRVCGQRITDKFRLHKGRKFCSQACLRKYGGNSMEHTVPCSAESPRKPADEEFSLSADLTRQEQRNIVQDACQSPHEQVRMFYTCI